MFEPPVTFRWARLARLAGTRGINWWTITVTPEQLIIPRQLLRAEHVFDRTATLLMPGRTPVSRRPLIVRRRDQLDWFVRVPRPMRLAEALCHAGWPIDDR